MKGGDFIQGYHYYVNIPRDYADAVNSYFGNPQEVGKTSKSSKNKPGIIVSRKASQVLCILLGAALGSIFTGLIKTKKG
jgi:hypothetical protein